jgi:hypothetical protein
MMSVKEEQQQRAHQLASKRVVDSLEQRWKNSPKRTSSKRKIHKKMLLSSMTLIVSRPGIEPMIIASEAGSLTIRL